MVACTVMRCSGVRHGWVVLQLGIVVVVDRVQSVASGIVTWLAMSNGVTPSSFG